MSFMIALQGAQRVLAGSLSPTSVTSGSIGKTQLAPKWHRLGVQMVEDLEALRRLEGEVLDSFHLQDPRSHRWHELWNRFEPIAHRVQHQYYIGEPLNSVDPALSRADLWECPSEIMAPHQLIDALAWKWLGHMKKKGFPVGGRSEWETYEPAGMFGLSARYFMQAAERYEDMGHFDVAVEFYLESACLSEQSSLRVHRLKESDEPNFTIRGDDLLKGYFYAYTIFEEILHDARRALQTAISYVGSFIWTGWNPEIFISHQLFNRYSSPLRRVQSLSLSAVEIYTQLLQFLSRANDLFVDSVYFKASLDDTLDTEGSMLLRQVEALRKTIEEKRGAAQPRGKKK